MDKDYTPEVVSDAPFPGEVEQLVTSSQTMVAGNYGPTQLNEKKFPKKRVAVELLSTALNTRSKKILQEFELQQSGGLKIGDFQEGLSGDVRITPNGLTGRNTAGLVTFALDTDGNLVLVGELRSGSVISGTVIVGDNNVVIEGDESRILIYDENGIARILLGRHENGF